MNKKLYYCVHSHRHGVSHYFAYSERDLTREDFIKAFEIDYEDDREDENLEVSEGIELDDIPVI